MVLTDARLIEVREHLQAELSGKPGRAREIARLLRAMNPTVTNALAIIDRLEAAGVTRALVDSLRAAHQGALDTSLDTLDAAIDNAPAYQQGAARVIEAFEDLESLSTRLAAEANLPSPSGEP